MKSLYRTSRFHGSVKSSWTIGKVLKPLDSLIKNCQLITTFLYIFHFFYGSLNTIKLYNKLHKILFIWGIILASLVVRSLPLCCLICHYSSTAENAGACNPNQLQIRGANVMPLVQGWLGRKTRRDSGGSWRLQHPWEKSASNSVSVNRDAWYSISLIPF